MDDRWPLAGRLNDSLTCVSWDRNAGVDTGANPAVAYGLAVNDEWRGVSGANPAVAYGSAEDDDWRSFSDTASKLCTPSIRFNSASRLATRFPAPSRTA